MRKARDLDLLRLEMDALWGRDVYGRPWRPHPLVAVAVARDGHDVRFSPLLSDETRRSLSEVGVLADFAGEPPPALESFRRRLAPLGPLRGGGGPSYLFAKGAPSPLPPSAGLRIVSSRGGGVRDVARPEPWWEPQEWADLLDGRLGPCAILAAGERVVALCHTSVASFEAAEAGVWTHPEERGRGWAGVVVAAWAKETERTFDALFYSADFDNAASQAVARKLGLRPLGTIWQLCGE